MDRELILVIIGGITLAIFILLELWKPERKYLKEIKKNSYVTNIELFVFNNVITYFAGLSAVYLLVHNFSLHQSFQQIPVWGQYVVGIVLLDFIIWIWHLVNHKITFLWLFHQTHHSEKYLNATSALRFHIGELVFSVIYKSTILIVLGIPLYVFFLYEFLITLFAIFHHSNIALPNRVRNIVEYFFITPRLHRVHHSDKRQEHDSNYGVIFVWWDKIFKTQQKRAPKNIGLSYGGEKNFVSFLLMPFVDRK